MDDDQTRDLPPCHVCGCTDPWIADPMTCPRCFVKRMTWEQTATVDAWVEASDSALKD